MDIPKYIRLVVLICLICFAATYLCWLAGENASEVCRAWCSGWPGQIPSVAAWYRCIVDCTEVFNNGG